MASPLNASDSVISRCRNIFERIYKKVRKGWSIERHEPSTIRAESMGLRISIKRAEEGTLLRESRLNKTKRMIYRCRTHIGS